MTDAKYQAFKALDPFFHIVRQGLGGYVDGDHGLRHTTSSCTARTRLSCIDPRMLV